MRVLHVQKVGGIGGSERHLLDLLPGLVERGVSTGMCVLAAGAYGRFVEPLRARGIDPALLPAGPHVNLRLPGRVAREVRRRAPDLVHTHLIHGALYGGLGARRACVPTVFSMHDVHAFWGREPYRTPARLAIRRAARAIAISEHVASFMRAHRMASPDRIRVVHYGIDVARWEPSEEARRLHRAAHGISEADVLVGVASRLIPLKGHLPLLEALRRARHESPELRLQIAGDGPLRTEIECGAAALEPGAATTLGFVADVPSFMAACDVVVVPTEPGLGEGFGLAALEGMASGRPVVATRAGSLPEVIGDTSGILVQPGDTDAFAAALVGLARDPSRRRDMGERGRERAATRFAIDAMIDGTIDVYREALGS